MDGAASRPRRRTPAESAVSQGRRKTLAEFDPTNNAGRPLYCVFAVAVVLSHALALGEFDESPRFAWSNYSVSFGTLGVAGFFVLGGFLLCASLERKPGVARFLITRFFRLVPLIWVSLLGTTLVLAPFSVWYRTRSLADFPFTGSDGAWRYLVRNVFLVQRQWSIGHTLDGLPFPVSWNGSLWTMASLFLAYLVLAALLAGGVLRGRRWLAPVAGLVFWLAMAMQSSGLFEIDVFDFDWVTETWQGTLLGPDSLQLISLFLFGCSMYLYRDHLGTGPVAILLVVAVLLGSMVRHDWHLFGGLAWAYLVLVMLVRLPWRLAAPLGLISFGIYVWAFPIEQLATLVGLSSVGYPLFAACCLTATALAAIATLYAVEQPSSRLGHLVESRVAALPSARRSSRMRDRSLRLATTPPESTAPSNQPASAPPIPMQPTADHSKTCDDSSAPSQVAS